MQVLSSVRSIMRLEKIRAFLQLRGMPHSYTEDDNCGSIDFIHRGLSYYIWEYPAPERGAQSNVRTAGRGEDFEGNYEEQILAILKTW